MGDGSSSSDSEYVWRRRDLFLSRRRASEDGPVTSSRRNVPFVITRRNDHNYVASENSESSAPASNPDVESNDISHDVEEHPTRASDVHRLPEEQPLPPRSVHLDLPEVMLRSSDTIDEEDNGELEEEDNGELEEADLSEAAAADRAPSLSPPKKRKRSVRPHTDVSTPKVKVGEGSGDDDDDGLICSICLDMWEMSGPHRLVSLHCGHLFGDACIRRWLKENTRSADRVCPQCKTRASPKDIRYLYARRLRCVDRSEEHRLREDLDVERDRSKTLQTELGSLQMSFNMISTNLKCLLVENERLKSALRLGSAGISYDGNVSDPKIVKSYKLYTERNIRVMRAGCSGGCRIICHAKNLSSLIISQKNANNMFPSFGLRFIDTPSFQMSGFMCVSSKIVRDVSLSSNENAVIVASREARCRIFDTRSRKPSTTLSGTDMVIWSCAFDGSCYDHYVYLGGQNGSIYVVDIRNTENIVTELETKGDLSPVIQITSVPPNTIFEKGGILVCKLQSLWFFEHNETISPTPSRVSADGPYLSIHYDVCYGNLLLSARPSVRHPNSRYMLGKLQRGESGVVFMPNVMFPGTSVSPVITRCTQINVEANTLVTAFMQDTKVLNLYDARRKSCIQSVAMDEIVYDACPVYLQHATFVAGVTENRCQIFKLVT